MSSNHIKFRKLLNDLKRRPIDAAKDLNITVLEIEKILNGKKKIDFKLINQAVKVWPVNYGDFFGINDDTSNGFKKFSRVLSNKTERIMIRKNQNYYKYKDTVMSKISSFRPEWIQELVVVKDNKPENKKVVFNNGHFLHQFTYFIGPVNFYYLENGKKKVAIMNTGDSMHISPYIPHSFTTRENKDGQLGLILALTYAGNIDGDVLNELSAIGKELAKNYNLDFQNKKGLFKENLKYFLNIASMSEGQLEKRLKINIKKIYQLNSLPPIKVIKKISDELDINIKDLIPPEKYDQVKITKYSKAKKWLLKKNRKKIYSLVQLTNVPQLPCSKAIELNILTNSRHSLWINVPSHQYIYNIGDKKINIKFRNIYKTIKPGDSVYLKPNIKHLFYGKSKLLILRIAGRLHNENIYHLSRLSNKNYDRLLKDNKPWFY